MSSLSSTRKVTILGPVDPKGNGVMILHNIRKFSPAKTESQIKVVDSWDSFVWPQFSRMWYVTGLCFWILYPSLFQKKKLIFTGAIVIPSKSQECLQRWCSYSSSYGYFSYSVYLSSHIIYFTDVSFVSSRNVTNIGIVRSIHVWYVSTHLNLTFSR